MRRSAARAQLIPGVGQVQYNQAWSKPWPAWSSTLRSLPLSSASFCRPIGHVIANTIRLALYSRREEIEILGMIGASTTFIRVPYLLEGAALGLLGSALSLVILKAGFELFRHEMPLAAHFLAWMRY